MMRQGGNIFVMLNNNIRSRNFQGGKNISDIFKAESQKGNTAINTSFQTLEQQVSIMPHPWRNVISNFYKGCFFSNRQGDFRSAFEHIHKSAEAFLNIYKDCQTNWLNLVVKTICLNVRIFGEKAYFTRKSLGAEITGGSDEMAMAVDICMRINRTTTGVDAKKPVILHLANQMFKIYFKMRNLNSTKQLIRTIESTVLGDDRRPPDYPFDRFSKSERVTWMYFSGVIAMLENNFTKAERNLSYAFRHCHVQSMKNKRKILERLIVVRMVMGRVPSDRLLQKYGMQRRYQALIYSYKIGDLEGFDRCLNKHYRAFFSQGTYLILHHSRVVVYRNFFKKVIRYYIEAEKERNVWKSRIRFDKLNKTLNKMFPSLKQPVDETECVLSNLIYKKYIAGYLSHQKRMLVIKDFTSAFPRITNQHER